MASTYRSDNIDSPLEQNGHSHLAHLAPPEIQHLFISLGVQHFDLLVQFYQQVCGQPPQRCNAGLYAEFCLQGMRLAIYAVPPTHSNLTLNPIPNPHAPGLGVCLQVLNLDAVLERLRSAIAHHPFPTAAIGTTLTPSHGREVHLLDPEGNRLILYEPLQP